MASFHEHLVINRWLLSLFNQKNLQVFKARLGDDEFEGLDENGQTKFFEQLNNSLFHTDLLPQTDLRRYDLNIVRHWQTITERRNQAAGHRLEMKYFQYLSLLFTEIYLDWYFNRKAELQTALNASLQQYAKEPFAKDLQNYRLDDLNKIAFWNATGSGKTLLMHVNIWQYLHYYGNGTGNTPDKIIVLTPNEALSRQHIAELEESQFSAALFNKSNQDLLKGQIEVIDVNKLADKHGDKTVAVSAFAGDNLVLVDEGHRGASGDEWMRRREQLISSGFAFEYSATFGQAVAKGKTVSEQEYEIQKKNAKLLPERLGRADIEKLVLTEAEQKQARQTAMFEVYAKAVLFDYSYKFFYADGYGKESLILNMENAAYQAHDKLYFTACLLAFYQQLYLFESQKTALIEWNIEKPLWVFVGNKVADDDSDILAVLQHLAHFLNQRTQVCSWLADLLADKARILDNKGNNIFTRRFIPLMDFVGKESALYDDILQKLFHADSNGRLQLRHLKNADGELALSVGGGKPFGIINIGDAAGFFKTAAKSTDFDSSDDAFSDGLFADLNQPQGAHLNLLIGSRKFTEGWSSWRVSTMGLLNMGRSEGAQIIQLFGRGVRLKGQGFSLKRSTRENRPKGLHLEKLETLNIFGIRASYMDQFKAYLQEEGITPPDEMLELNFKVQPNLPKVKLKTLRLKDGYKDHQKQGFKRTQNVWLYEIPKQWQGKIKPPHTLLDRYPRVQALSTSGIHHNEQEQRQTHAINAELLDLFDWETIYLRLLSHKLQNSRNNLKLDKSRLKAFVEKEHGWYTLYIPDAEMQIRSYSDVFKQQSLLIDLLCDYSDRFYKSLQAAYEAQFYETVEVDEENGSMQNNYQFKLEPTSDGLEYEQRLLALKNHVETGDIKAAMNWNAPNITAICFPAHLYYPIMTLQNQDTLPLKMSPMAMNENSEIRFVQDLQKASENGDLHKWIAGKSLYLMRNAGNKAKGLGFALAGNFYPDFLLWLVDETRGRQWLSFIDPKGIRQMNLNDPKFGLAAEVKKLEQDLQLDISLSSFVLSVTAKQDLLNAEHLSGSLFDEKQILFMDEQNYLPKMFEMILQSKK